MSLLAEILGRSASRVAGQSAQKRLHHAIVSCNVTRPVARHLFGHDHTVTHRMVVGLVVMSAGVMVSKLELHGIPAWHYVADGIGYFIHGLGAAPFIEYFIGEEAGVGAALGQAIDAVEEVGPEL